MARVLLSAAAAAAATAQSNCTPSMFWVNYMNTPDQLAVSWTTACASASVCVYGTNPSTGSTATGNVTQYTFPGNNYVSPYIHHVLLTGLQPDTVYYYKVGDGTAGGMSAIMNVTTHPGEGLTGYPFLFAVLGDLGQTNNSVDTMAHITANPNVRSIIHAGDLSYADGLQARWDSWQDLVSPISQSIPWMTIVGNHEIELDINLKTFEAYSARWLMPAIYYGTPQQTNTLYYSFRVAGVHWLMLSSYTDYSSTSAQFAWLKQELASVDRSITPWLIAVLHAPWYNSNTAHQGEGEAMREAMEQMLFDANVDMVFAGHVHAYERNFRVFDMALNPAGPYYITIGDGGNREGLAANWMNPQPAWSAFRQASYGHGELEVINATALHWTWHQNPDLEPVVADELWIVKGQSTESPHQLTAQPRFRNKALNKQ